MRLILEDVDEPLSVRLRPGSADKPSEKAERIFSGHPRRHCIEIVPCPNRAACLAQYELTLAVIQGQHIKVRRSPCDDHYQSKENDDRNHVHRYDMRPIYQVLARLGNNADIVDNACSPFVKVQKLNVYPHLKSGDLRRSFWILFGSHPGAKVSKVFVTR